jgi:glucose-6-phosphate 1-dehydrogenase
MSIGSIGLFARDRSKQGRANRPSRKGDGNRNMRDVPYDTIGAPQSTRPYPLEEADIVLFGSTGDLTHRKIAPALYRLHRAGILPAGARILGMARRPLSDDDFRAGLKTACRAHHGSEPFDEAAWESFESRIRYSSGDLENPDDYRTLKDAFFSGRNADRNILFYLACAPDQFAQAVENLGASGLVLPGRSPSSRPYRRLVAEKPFGTDRCSARALNRVLGKYFAEEDIFRIDHYLGKETVQNLIWFRFANTVFEPLWNRKYVESVSIDVLEVDGIGTRGGFYDKTGAARDMLQNHLFQLLCLVAMEPPEVLDTEVIRDAKLRVLRAIPKYTPGELRERSVRGQYAKGKSARGVELPDYRAEPRVRADSETETFVSLRLDVDTWRWNGVPFILTTGKALDRQASEIVIKFKRPADSLFEGLGLPDLAGNELIIKIQPEEGMSLAFNTKAPGISQAAREEFRVSFRERFEEKAPEAYERLLADALAGDSTLFIRFDEAEEAWRIADALRASWDSDAAPIALYPAGSKGPGKARVELPESAARRAAPSASA